MQQGENKNGKKTLYLFFCLVLAKDMELHQAPVNCVGVFHITNLVLFFFIKYPRINLLNIIVS